MKNIEQSVLNTLSNDSFLQVNKAILRDLGNANAVLVLTSLISKYSYFKNRGELVNKAFFNTKEMLIDELGLSEKVILRAEQLLESKGYVTSQLKGLPRKKYYTIQWERIERTLQNVCAQHTDGMVRTIPNMRGNNNHNNTHLTKTTNENRMNNNQSVNVDTSTNGTSGEPNTIIPRLSPSSFLSAEDANQFNLSLSKI